MRDVGFWGDERVMFLRRALFLALFEARWAGCEIWFRRLLGTFYPAFGG
jgi:hypothetical protein